MPRRTHPTKRPHGPQVTPQEAVEDVTPTMLALDLVTRGISPHIILEPSELAHNMPRRATT